jgi:tetratricopeptide (TPR) repeat protein
VFWVHASNSARVEEAFNEIAESVGLTCQPVAAADILPLVQRWLSNEANGRWLVIVDNVDDEITVEVKDGQKLSLSSLLPQANHGAVLVTSRNADVARHLVGREQDILEVGVMAEHEATQLLQKKLKGAHQDGLAQLVEALDCIPLAVTQAAAYINRLGPRMSVTRYLKELAAAERQVQLLHNAAPDMRRDEKALNSVLATWQISFEYIRSKRPSAAHLLSFMSFFNRQGIPEFVVRHYLDDDGESQDIAPAQSLEGADTDFEEDVVILRGFSLVGIAQDNASFEMHGLVQLATRTWLKSTKSHGRWYELFIKAMAQEFPDGEYTNWPTCQALFPHVLTSIDREDTEHQETKELALLLNNTGWYAWRQGLFVQAEALVSRALKVREEILDTEDPSLLLSMSLLGSILDNLGKYKEAEQMYGQELELSKKVHGAENLETLTSMNNLAVVLRKQGKNKEAEEMHRQVLAVKEEGLGARHPSTLMSMNNLAGVLGRQGKDKEAEKMHRHVLMAREQELGPRHPDTLSSMNNLAAVLGRQGKNKEAEAEEMHRHVLAVWEEELGARHPSTLMSMNNLASVLGQQGKNKEAEEMHRHVLAVWEEKLGARHPSTLTSMNNLAGVLGRQGKNKEAEEMHRHVLAVWEEELDARHPDTLSSMNNLAGVLGKQGKNKEAEEMHRQVLAVRQEELGARHPDTLMSVYSLAYLLAKEHRYDDATPLYERACSGFTSALGEEHPTTRACYEHYADMVSLEGRGHLSRPSEAPDIT